MKTSLCIQVYSFDLNSGQMHQRYDGVGNKVSSTKLSGFATIQVTDTDSDLSKMCKFYITKKDRLVFLPPMRQENTQRQI